ncbi:DUF202 domain-containing protein [Spirillospora sp. NPDC029432]|uniref:DUF202 domain-containing protein n=1 Tax=Spirillospora sp. NPDC029432 TaxID=3154599 RepID=UPI0034539B70
MRLWDPGAQPERTALAWSRTTLSLIVAGLLCVRFAPTAPSAALAAAAVCGAVSLQLRRTQKQHVRRTSAPPAVDPVSVALATAVTVLLGLTGLLLALA